MRRIWIGIVAVLWVSVSLLAVANAMTDEERKDNLLALYMVRASEPVCGFRMTVEQRSEVANATRLFEEKLGFSSEQSDEIYRKVVQSMESQKAGGLCNPDGEHARVFRQAVEGLAPSGAGASDHAASTGSTASASSAPTAKAGATPTPTPSPAAAPSSSSEAATLKGLKAWQAVQGNTIVGRRNGLDYADYYAPNGRIVSLDGSDIETGSWKLKGDRLCTHSPSEGDACYRIEVLDDIATFIDEDGAGFRGSIVKGNAKNL